MLDELSKQKKLIYQEISNILHDFSWVEQYSTSSLLKLKIKKPRFVRSELTLIIGQHFQVPKETISKLALIGELLHFATKLHDEISNDKNEKAIKNNESCVLLGDYIYTVAYQKMLEINNMEIMAIFAKHCELMAECEVDGNITDKYALLFRALGQCITILALQKNNINLIPELFYQYGCFYISKEELYKENYSNILKTLDITLAL